MSTGKWLLITSGFGCLGNGVWQAELPEHILENSEGVGLLGALRTSERLLGTDADRVDE
jgi:hypothetical protein